MNAHHDPKGSRLLGQLVAMGSVASGVAVVLAPERMADLYALPRHQPGLVRALGVRDVAIGILLFRPSTEHVGYQARAASDVLDVALMLREVVSGRRRFSFVAPRLVGGVVSIALALRGVLARRPRIRVDGA